MVRVQVENLSKPCSPAVVLITSRVPCEGEYLILEDDESPKYVHTVYHYADKVAQNEIAAIVRVKG